MTSTSSSGCLAFFLGVYVSSASFDGAGVCGVLPVIFVFKHYQVSVSEAGLVVMSVQEATKITIESY